MAITLTESRPRLLARLSLAWPHLSTCMVISLLFPRWKFAEYNVGGNVRLWHPYALLVQHYACTEYRGCLYVPRLPTLHRVCPSQTNIGMG